MLWTFSTKHRIAGHVCVGDDVEFDINAEDGKELTTKEERGKQVDIPVEK